MKYTPYLWPQVVAVMALIGLITPVRRFRHLPAIRPFCISLGMTTLGAFFSLLDIATVEMPLKIVWTQLGFIAIVTLPVAFLALALEYTGRGAWMTSRRLAALLAVPALIVGLVLTSERHELFRHAYHLETTGTLTVLHWANGIAAWADLIYAWGLRLVAGALLLLALRDRTVPKRDTLAMILALLVASITHTLSTSAYTVILGINTETVSHVLGGGIGIWALLRHQVLGIAPVAYSTVVATIGDPVIVFDARQRVAIANPAAQATCGLPRHVVGAAMRDLPPAWATLFRRYDAAVTVREEVTVGEDADRRVYELTVSPIQAAPGRRPRADIAKGQVFLLHDITERKMTETSLRQFSQVIEHAPTPIVITNPAGDILAVNPAFEQVTGYSAAEANGQNPRLLKSGHHPIRFYEEMWATVCAGNTWRGEFLNRRKDGGTYWENAAIAPVTDARGAITHFVGVKEDITARKAAEARLRESEARYRLLTENLLDVVWILDVDTNRFRYVSASVERLRGYTVDEVLSQDMSTAVTPASLAYLQDVIPQRVARFRQGGNDSFTDEIEQPRKDGATVWTEVTSRFMLNDETGHVEVFGVSRDTSDRKRVETEIARTQARLKSLVNILQYQPDSTQAYLDFTLTEALALTESEIGYIYYYDEVSQEFELNTWSKGVMDVCAITEPQTLYQLEKTGIWGEAVRQRRPILIDDYHAPHALKHGYPEGHAPLHTFMTLPIFQSGLIVAVIGLANKKSAYDDTDVLQVTLLMDTVWSVLEHRRAQEALHRYARDLEEQNRELDAFAHTVAHDLRNSLGGISGAVELLSDETGISEYGAFALDAMTWSVNKLQTIIDELMILSGVRKQTVVPVPLDMVAVLAEAQQRLRDQVDQAGAEITVCDPDCWPVTLGHAAWIEEVWTNYLSNAIKYGGRPPRITVGARPEGNGAARFWIQDNGPGIRPEDRARLFAPFARLEQARTQGHGLGLSIVRRIVEKLGGEVGVEGHDGDGSTFYFTLPLAE